MVGVLALFLVPRGRGRGLGPRPTGGRRRRLAYRPPGRRTATCLVDGRSPPCLLSRRSPPCLVGGRSPPCLVHGRFPPRLVRGRSPSCLLGRRTTAACLLARLTATCLLNGLTAPCLLSGRPMIGGRPLASRWRRLALWPCAQRLCAFLCRPLRGEGAPLATLPRRLGFGLRGALSRCGARSSQRRAFGARRGRAGGLLQLDRGHALLSGGGLTTRTVP